MAPEKVGGPATCITFLGLELDSTLMELICCPQSNFCGSSPNSFMARQKDSNQTRVANDYWPPISCCNGGPARENLHLRPPQGIQDSQMAKSLGPIELGLSGQLSLVEHVPRRVERHINDASSPTLSRLHIRHIWIMGMWHNF